MSTKICPVCNKEYDNTVNICPDCGVKLPEEIKIKKIERRKKAPKQQIKEEEQIIEEKKEISEEIIEEKAITSEEKVTDNQEEFEDSFAVMGFAVDEEQLPEQETEIGKNVIHTEELHPHIEMSSQELKKYAQTQLSKIALDEDMERTLYPLIAKSVRGYRAFVIGEMGTKKEETLDAITELLYNIGKISENKITKIAFGDIPEQFEINKVYVIDDLSTAVSYLFNLEDFSENASHQQKYYLELMERLMQAPRTAYIFLDCKIEEYSGFKVLDGRINYIFENKITFPNLTNEEIYEKFYELIPDSHIRQIDTDPLFKTKFIEYLERNKRFFPFANQELANFLADYAVRDDKIQLPKDKYKPNVLEDEFSKIIGMENVKAQVRELNNYLRVRGELEKAGAKLPSFNMHMMFLGNPGVGKTSIARIISRILFEMGFTREDKLVEVTSKDLIGAYGNQTGIKTNRVIMRALGGVLFVDEAYALSNSCGQAGEEAIAILIKAMMDYKDDLVVMFAGYTLEMRTFVESNSGISSRISYIFKFEDYSPEELYDIFLLKLGFIGMTLAPDAEETVRKICKFASGRKNAGNGRFIDNLIQKALTKHALLKLGPDKIMELQKKSIPAVEDIMSTTFN